MPQIEVRMVFESKAEMLAELGGKAELAHVAPPTPTDEQKPESEPKKPAKRTRAKKTAEPAPKPETKQTEPADPKPAEAEAKTPTKEDATAALMKVSEARGMPAAKGVLAQFSVSRISEVPEDKYAKFIEACEKEVA